MLALSALYFLAAVFRRMTRICFMSPLSVWQQLFVAFPLMMMLLLSLTTNDLDYVLSFIVLLLSFTFIVIDDKFEQAW